ncbi:polysaccharide pyruvyl transferase family protein [Occultella aeris]|uniref:Colanic acid biosynthesis protein n=1 Tax=Occultella aeris TaxID=2761496 RepID=A0A7M4DI77_9MICO|nr:polysaccharide pyruvyl transferase family protein [Occultella aeris]VZO36641.1 colanic acid biosynthesis protein [Occultella aeris]
MGDLTHTSYMPELRLVLAGTGLDNDNRGVEALGRSVIDAVVNDGRTARLSILDNGWGVRPSGTVAGSLPAEFVGARLSRRWHRPESWMQIRVAQAVGGLSNPVARRFSEAAALLDLSAGDSFTDLYGKTRLDMIAAPKSAAIRAGLPLVFLPQTYGPFNTTYGRRTARRLVRSAALAYSRDAWSHQQLLELAGPEADVSRLREGVDVAFALDQQRPAEPVAAEIEARSDDVVAGVNVSGLLYGRERQERFGIAGDYAATMTTLVRALINDGAHVMFVPHVHGGWGESDLAAARGIVENLTESERVRTSLVPSELRASELKWCIARSAWFIGSRMHATIAALSSATPAFGYAYSDKTLGVFATCEMQDHVADARAVAGDEAVRRAVQSFRSRELTRSTLQRTTPPVIQRARAQIHEVLDDVAEWSGSSQSARTIA